MAQGFANPQGVTLPVAVDQGGTGGVTADAAKANLEVAAPNIVIGGNFTTNPWQRGTSFAAAGDGDYTADRFRWETSGVGVVTIAQTADAPTAAEAGIYSTDCLHVDVTTIDATIGAGDYYAIGYYVEGLDIAAAGFGQSGTRNVTLSFWHKHTVTGTYCVTLSNSANDRAYVAEYTQSVTDTWERSTVTIPVDTSGTWLYTNGRGLKITFAIAVGSTYQTTAGSWAAGFYFASSNQVNGMSSTSNNSKVQLIKLELGSSATPYPVELEADVLARCQRYTQVIDYNNALDIACGFFQTSTVLRCYQSLKVNMRAIPSVTYAGTTSNFILERPGTSAASMTSIQAASKLEAWGFRHNMTSASAGTSTNPTIIAVRTDAVITVSAEL